MSVGKQMRNSMKQEDIDMTRCYSMGCDEPVFVKSIWPHNTALEYGLLLPWCNDCWDHSGDDELVFQFTEDDFWKEVWSD